ncbi:MAG TPA: tetratricopeptide repeat protein [Kofleriaceae bacterium]|nr:tetratricopeptide repeat protein [Kofleriaceae bacterium]
MGIRRSGAAIALVCAFAATAAAQKSRKPEAEALFKQAKAEMAKGNFADACEKFQSSQDLDPRASTLMNLGACHESAKKLVSAWYAFVEATKLAERSSDEQALASPSKKRADALEPRLSSLKVVVGPDARVKGLEILRDGEAIVEGQWNSEVFVDGGEYEIIARAPGSTAWTAKIGVASELDRKVLEIPKLKVDPITETVAVETPPSGGAPAEPEPEDPQPIDRPSSFTGMRKAAIGVTAVGVAAIAGGVVFGLKAKGLASDSDAICPTDVCDDPEGLRLNKDARSAASKANIFLIGGGVAVAGGVVLWVIGGPTSVAPMADRDTVGLVFTGGF